MAMYWPQVHHHMCELSASVRYILLWFVRNV